MFNRKRIGDVQYLHVETYKKNSILTNNEDFENSLTPVEKILSQKFKRVITDGKHSKPVPILFSQKIQKFITLILKVRETFNIVPKTNPYLFANPNSLKSWMSGVHVMRRLANASGAQKPHLLTSSRFRKHIATTLQLMDMESTEMEQVATFMGHTKKTHEEFYRLPQDIYQTAKVAKILLLLEKGRGHQFKGKNLEEIELDKDVYYSSEEEAEIQDEEKEIMPMKQDITRSNDQNEENQISSFNIKQAEVEKVDILNLDELIKENNEMRNENHKEVSQLNEPKVYKKRNTVKTQSETKPILPHMQESKSKNSMRIKWSSEEQKIIKHYFRENIKNKITPRKTECQNFLEQYGSQFINKDWVRIKTFVYNTFRNK
ncbi:hypothetical protein ABEB36_000096 [Hypothenemus hampei]